MMEKVLFVILAATYSLCYKTIDFQEIRLAASKYHLTDRDLGEKYSILNSRPLQIVFEDFDAKTVKCRTNHKHIFGCHGESCFSNGTTIIRIDKITSDMSAKWRCDLIDIKNSETHYIFDIRVKAAKTVLAYIDRTLLQYTFTNDSVLEYDGVNKYLCEEGVTINLDCRHTFPDGSLILKYYNSNGSKLIGTDYVDKVKDSEDKLTFRVLMSSKVNKSYVECTYLTALDHEKHQQEFTYRIIFIISKDPVKNDYFSITINDMKIKSKPGKVNNRDIYNYDFIYGENLVITCEKEDINIFGYISMGTAISPTMRNGTYIYTKDLERTQSVYKLFVETSYLDRGQIEFFLFDSKSNEYLCALINFYVASVDGPAIVGLPANNMLYQYNKNKKEWVAHYQYTPNERFLLTCITSKNKTLRWLQGANMGHISKGKNNIAGIKFIRDMFTLDENDITCQFVDKSKESWTLKFHRKPDLPPMKPHENNDAPDVPQNIIVIVGSTVGVLLVIVIIAISVFYWHKRHRTKIQKEPSLKFSGTDNPISDIVNQNNGEYTYIANEYNYIKSDDSATTSNSLYCRYTSNNMNSETPYSGNTENHYTEIDDYFRRNTDNFTPTNKVSYENTKCDYVTSSSAPTYNNM